jgi:arylsulfatase
MHLFFILLWVIFNPVITTCNPIVTGENPMATDCPSGAFPRDRASLVLKEWMRDPFITSGPDDNYFLTCTRLWHSSFKPGMEMWKSADLVNWEPMGLVWSFDDSRWMAGPLAKMKEEMKKDAHLWAPEIRHIDGRWVSVFTTSLRYSNLAVSEGAGVEGPWSEPFGEAIHYKHDPSVFVDTDGSRWLVWACTKIARLKDDFSGFAGPEIGIAPSNRKMGHEGCFILRIEGKYVLFGTAWSQDILRHGSYNLYYCTADKIEGPYGPRKFAGRFLGHGTLFRDNAGQWWCTAFQNGTYVTPEHVARHGISKTKAETINPQGLTLVPMDIRMEDGEVVVRALDPLYAKPGEDEIQDFKNDNVK